MIGREGEYILRRDSFVEVEDYEKEVAIVINNLLLERFRLFHINTWDINNLEFNQKFKVGMDTFIAHEDFSRKLRVFKTYNIKMLEVESTEEFTRILIPLREVNYNKSIGHPSSINYIPSTSEFINSFNPKSGYKK